MPKFGYAVKYNGKYYPADADIPETVPDVKDREEPAKKPEATKRRKKGDV